MHKDKRYINIYKNTGTYCILKYRVNGSLWEWERLKVREIDRERDREKERER